MLMAADDEREGYCRVLGHPVPFRYCRQLPEGQPCRLILDCWHERFDVQAFVRQHYTPEQVEAILAPPKTKLASIVELIEQARKAQT